MLGLPHTASAAALTEVKDYGGSPGGARMFIYVPDKPAAAPPILVAIHYCGGNANAFFTGTGYRQLADKHGFIVIYPQTTSSDGCFDVHSDATLKHDGGSDSGAIAAMVRYTLSQYMGDAGRVYVTGTSSGAMMTNVLLGAYPDVFRGGAPFAGVPYACFAGSGAWNSACSSGQTTKTGMQWGDLVRAAYPGYSGPRPRVQLWHGDRDETLNFHNFGEAIKQWTNVLGVSETPTSTEMNAPQQGWTRTRYADASGIVQVEAVREAGMTHNLTVRADEVVRFFGLDAAADPGGPGVSSAGTGAAGSAAAPGSSAAGSGGMSAPRAGAPGRAGASGAAGRSAGSAAGAGPSLAGSGGSSTPNAAAGGGMPIAGAAAGTAAPAPQTDMMHDTAGAGGSFQPSPSSSETDGSCSFSGAPRARGSAALWSLAFLTGSALRRRRRLGRFDPTLPSSST